MEDFLYFGNGCSVLLLREYFAAQACVTSRLQLREQPITLAFHYVIITTRRSTRRRLAHAHSDSSKIHIWRHTISLRFTECAFLSRNEPAFVSSIKNKFWPQTNYRQIRALQSVLNDERLRKCISNSSQLILAISMHASGGIGENCVKW